MSTSSQEEQKPPLQSLSRITDFKPEDLLHVSNIQGRRWRNVFKVNIKHVYTVGMLKMVISSRHGHPVVALLYRGVCLADDHKLPHLIPDLQNIGAPRFSVHTRLPTHPKPGGMSLHVKGLQGASFQLHLLARSTVAELIAAIVNYEAYSSDKDIEITCGGKSLSALDSSLALAKCNLASGSVVHVVGKLLGGGVKGDLVRKFVDMEMLSALRTCGVRDWIPGDPIWSIIIPGVNVEGKCENRFCEAFGEVVFCKKGLVVFNITEVVYCPACELAFTATTVGFYKCQWMFEGRKAGVTPIDMMSKWYMTNGNRYQWFDDQEGQNVALWCNLVITAKALPSEDTKKGLLDPRDCAICFGTLSANPPISNNIDMACGHRVHYLQDRFPNVGLYHLPDLPRFHCS